jgi:hypothetical protein
MEKEGFFMCKIANMPHWRWTGSMMSVGIVGIAGIMQDWKTPQRGKVDQQGKDRTASSQMMENHIANYARGGGALRFDTPGSAEMFGQGVNMTQLPGQRIVLRVMPKGD